MKCDLKTFSIVFSVILHLAIISGFVYLSKQAHKNGLWSGGLGTGNYRVAYVDLGNMQSLTNNINTTETKAIKKSKTGTIKTKQNKKLAPSNKKQQALTSSGKGNSDTPSGGTGPGLDKNGIISDLPPNTLALIRKKILRKKKYPIIAKENGWQGIVKIQFKINESGNLDFVKIVKGSGFSILDSAAKSSVKKAAPLPYYPYPIVVDLEYKLLNR